MPDKFEVLFSRDDCPDCGGKRRALADTAQEEVEAGKFSKEMANLGVGIPSSGLVVDPTKNVLMAPQVTIVEDYCLDCGKKYTTKIIRQRVAVSIRAAPPGPGGQGGLGGLGPQFRGPFGKG